MIAITAVSLVALYCVASMYYIYQFRGDVRWADSTEYLRKSWFIFAPVNCFLYLFSESRAKRATMDIAQYPELSILQENWEIIRDEAVALNAGEQIAGTANPESGAYYDLGFRTFYKYGWRKFYLHWYGYQHQSALRQCPKTLELLKQVPSVRGAMFSLLPPGGQLTRHTDPIACSIRYHLGLDTPNDDDCYINVDGNVHSWRNGECFLFDETHLHFAKNDSQQPRLILMCDVQRPLNPLVRWVNALFFQVMRVSVVPNDETDQAGLVSRIFRGVTPILAWSKELKERNRSAYKLLKHSVNLLLAAIVFGLIYALFLLLQGLFA